MIQEEDYNTSLIKKHIESLESGQKKLEPRDSYYSIVSMQKIEPENIPLEDMDRKQILELFKMVFIFTCSICLGLLLQMIILSINMHFVGALADPMPLDALGFAIVIINCTGGFLMIGFNQGTGSFIGRAHGKGEKNLVNNYFNKGFFMFLIIYCGFAFIMYNSDSLLKILGQDELLAEETQRYGVAILPGIFFNYFFDLLRNFLNGQEIYKAPMLILIAACPFHYILCASLFGSYEVEATIISTNITYFLVFASLVVYLVKSGNTPHFTTKNLFWNFKSYAKETAAIALPLQIDVLGFEVNSVLVGLLGDLKQFGAHISFCNFCGMFFSFPVGMGASFMLMTSNAVGKNCKVSVQNYKKLAYYCGIIFGGFFTILEIVFVNAASSYYSADPEIKAYFVRIMIIYAICTIPDFCAQAVAGFLKGIGKSKDGLLAFILAYYVIGMPCSAYLGLNTSLELYGFWIGFGIAIFTILTIMTVLVFKIDIPTQIEELYQKIISDSDFLHKQALELERLDKLEGNN